MFLFVCKQNVEHVVHMGKVRNAYKILIRKPEAKRPLRRSRHRWEDNIGKYLSEIEWEDVDWMYLA